MVSKSQNTPPAKGTRRNHTGLFKPGQSGNPGGRPKEVKHVVELARLHTVEAIKALQEIVSDDTKPPQARVAAAQALLDRGWGKAPQSVEVTGKDGDSLMPEYTEEELIARLMAKRQHREGKRRN